MSLTTYFFSLSLFYSESRSRGRQPAIRLAAVGAVAVPKRALASSPLIRSNDSTIFIMKSMSVNSGLFSVLSPGLVVVCLGICLWVFVKVEGVAVGGRLCTAGC